MGINRIGPEGNDCALHAIHAEEIAAFFTNPALALGRSLLRGLPSCNLRSVWRDIHFVTVAVSADPHGTASALLSGGDEFGDVVCHRSRFLSPDVVQAWSAELQRIEDSVVEAWFTHRMAAAKRDDAASKPGDFVSRFRWDCDHRPECSQVEADVESWTLEQAEEYESLVHTLCELKTYVARVAEDGHGLVIVIC